MHAVEQADVGAGEGLCIFGWPDRLAAIATFVHRGHDRVIAVDLSARRRQLARDLGAQAALDPTTRDIWGELAALHGEVRSGSGSAPSTSAFIEPRERAA
jgi:(R,R)-butanediol dehydrogenase/meso-butanediol dehydrogenase/diacetyl reductase